MANITPTMVNLDSAKLITWPLMLLSDVGLPVEQVRYPDRSIMVIGTWGVGGSVTFYGSNNGTNYYALTDPQGNPITMTANAIKQITEFTQYIKATVTAGDGTTSLTVTLLMRAPQPLRK